MFTPYEIIRKKRDGEALSKEEIEYFVKGYTSGGIPDYQVSSLLMSIFFTGMSDEELLHLTRAMMATGVIVDLSDIPGCKADKHSTGGVGDKISLILAPLAAACGLKVPMVSGRGLGHTGGTIDKLESIPGFRTKMSIEDYKKILKKVGLVMSAQSDDLVPADRKLYALRDVTATVESIPLITSSIMSKKLAEGIDTLVLDVKVGSGAFMKNIDDARALAQKMVQVGKLYGKKVAVYLTDMSQPLGREIGNWSEVVESIKVLRGESDVEDVIELTVVLAAEMIALCSGENISNASERVRNALKSGAGYEKFIEMVRAQGGDVSVVEDLSKYPKPKIVREIKASASGCVTSIDTFKIGVAAVKLGAGRLKVGDKVDPVVGITVLKKIGDKVSSGDVIAIVHANEENIVKPVTDEILSAYKFSDAKPGKQELVKERIA
ncbi:MAG: thymidine phosphorylase [Bacteroidetes bacterium]|nr:thymidine phosphorylase [Bacteroidota bacterium]MCL5737921.1 thymidine phosphorylase [Bacteroidota bacterium]